MAHSYAQNILHIVFSTKDRHQLISKELQPRMWSYIAGICKADAIFVHVVGGSDNHVHLLIQLPANWTVAEGINLIKSNSSKWAGNKFAWQQDYAAFSVSASLVPAVVRYIRNQEAHHKRMSFDEELIALLKKHGVEYDPKYVFG
ncbi:MAG TPA: transposase [Candidatus Acidoferrales bacterium]